MRALAVIAATLAAAAAAKAAEPPRGIAPLSVVGSCGEPVGLPESGPPGRRVLFDRVAMPRTSFELRPVFFPSAHKPLPYFAKFGLFLRDRTSPVELVVPRGSRPVFAIGWGDRGPQQASVVRVVGCTSTRRWVAYAGGFYVARPACVPLVVRAGGKSARVWIALGRPCTSSSRVSARHLEAWAASGGKPLVGISTAGFRGPLVQRLSPGAFRIRVRAATDMPFALHGPGVERKTRVSAHESYAVYATWSVRLQPGTYRYGAEGGWANALRASGIRVQRSFVVR